MHALGWSRQRAIDYLLAHTAETPERIAAEVDRYIAVPGQATAYMVGNLEIRRLRELAQTELGPGFRVQDFHDRVLEDGAVTLVDAARRRSSVDRRGEGGGGELGAQGDADGAPSQPRQPGPRTTGPASRRCARRRAAPARR